MAAAITMAATTIAAGDYPYWGWGWGWGAWPYYSSWWWGGPSVYVAGGDGYGDGNVDVAARTGRYAIVKTDVSPEEAEVFLDGKYIGTADDFDGIPDVLYLGPGKYHLEFRLPNYQSFATDLDVARGQQVRLDQKLKVEPGKSALDQFPPASKGTPLGRVFTKGPDGTGEAAPPPAPRHSNRRDDGWSDRDAPPSQERVSEEYMDVRPEPLPRPAGNRARMRFKVTPEDAAVYVDDRYLGAGGGPRGEPARRRHGSRHAHDHRRAPRLQDEDGRRHRAHRRPGGRRRGAREVRTPRGRRQQRGPGKPGPFRFLRTFVERSASPARSDASACRLPAVSARGLLLPTAIVGSKRELGRFLSPVDGSRSRELSR